MVIVLFLPVYWLWARLKRSRQGAGSGQEFQKAE